MAETDQVLKVDAAGRVGTPRPRREAVLDEFERCGMPATKFAEFVGVKYQTFASWVQQRRRQRHAGAPSAGQAPALRWVEAALGVPGAGLCVHLEGGARMEITDAGQAKLAAALLRALAEGGALVLSFTGGLRVFLCVEACDLRKGFEGLHALVGGRLGEDVRGGALFVFTNQRHTRLKMARAFFS